MVINIMIKKHSLKEIFQDPKYFDNDKILFSEGFWSDLAVAVASGGKDSVKQMITNKITDFAKTAQNADAKITLDMVKKFKKLGLNNMWGEDLDELEKELTKRVSDGDKKNDKIDINKLVNALGLKNESASTRNSSSKYSLKEIFLK